MASKSPEWEKHAASFIKEIDKQISGISIPDNKMKQKIADIVTNKWKDKTGKDYWDYQESKIWKPEKIAEEEKQSQIKKDLWEQMHKEWIWEEKHKFTKDPVDRLREEFRKEIAEIKDAIRKIGILLDSDAPTEEQLKKHKALREAYLKYKMLEKLILGGDGKGDEGQDGG